MKARLYSWWQQIKIHPVRTVLIALLAVVIVLIILSILGYILNWGWTGLGTYISPPYPKDSTFQRGKTFWDWLQLLIIPLALAIIAIFFNRSERKNEQRIASDNQQEVALQDYIKDMSELLLERNLRKSDGDAEVRNIARVRTLTVLPRLDGKRKRNVLLFLYDADLIDKGRQIIDVSDADFSEADLSEVSLSRPKWIRRNSYEKEAITVISADLSGVNLRNANLNGANLFRAKLSVEAESQDDYQFEDEIAWLDKRSITANLSKAKLVKADLSGAVLS
jgi:uncharacterized protein YjbI with pentapeptide repeats